MTEETKKIDAVEPETTVEDAPIVQVATKDQAIASVLKQIHLSKDDAGASSIYEGVAYLYDLYENDGVLPTKEALAKTEAVTSAGLVDAVLGIEGNPFEASKKRAKYLVGGTVAALVVALVAGGVWITLGQGQAAPETKPTEQAVAQEDKAPETVTLTLRADLEGWNEKSTPVIAHIVSKDGKVDTYHAFAANADEKLELVEGEYTVTYISPINEDGSIYKVTQPSKGETSATFVKVPADQVTQEQLDEILDGIKDAVSKGDSTLKGDAGSTIAEQAGTNAAANPNADKDKVSQTTEAAKEEAAKPSEDTTGSTGTTTNNSAGSSNSGTGAPSAPAHQHNWVEQTDQQWVQDSAAWDEPVYTTVNDYETVSYIQFTDGHICYTNAEAAAYEKQLAMSGVFISSSVVTEQRVVGSHQEQTGTIHHEATGHYETVTTGYKCSGCGATK